MNHNVISFEFIRSLFPGDSENFKRWCQIEERNLNSYVIGRKGLSQELEFAIEIIARILNKVTVENKFLSTLK